MDAKRVFDEIKKYLTSDRPRVLFDLDSTLYNVSGRTRAILHTLADEKSFRERYPQESEVLKTLDIRPSDWGIRESLSRARLQSTIDFFGAVREFWREHFFSNRYLHADVPYEGAVDYVNALEKSGVDLLYLTGRDAPNMQRGTLESLEKWGFPVSQIETRLIMKPFKGAVEDEDFKSQRIQALKTRPANMWFFENEPVIINRVRQSHPEVRVVFLNTTHSGREHPPAELPRISGRYFR